MKMTLVKKFFITVTSFSLLITASAIAYVGVYSRIGMLMSELDRFDADIASQRKEQQQLGSLTRLLRDHRADFNRLQNFTIDQTNLSAFLNVFETLAVRTDTAIVINLDNRTTANRNMAFQFSIEGAEANVAAMLTLIEHAPYELMIDGISIQKISGEQSGVQLTSGSGASARSTQARMLINVRVKAPL